MAAAFRTPLEILDFINHPAAEVSPALEVFALSLRAFESSIDDTPRRPPVEANREMIPQRRGTRFLATEIGNPP